MISKEVIRRVARIARIDLREEEIKNFTKQIQEVLNAFRTLNKVDTHDVEPSFQPIRIENVWRKDKVKAWKWDPLSNTKHKENHYFKGPRAV